MNYQIIAPFLTAIIILGFSVGVYLHNRHSKIHVTYSLFAFFVALWSLGITLLYYSQEQSILLLLANFLYFTGGTIPVLFFYFSLLFPNEQFSLSRLTRIFIFLPTALFFVLYFFTDSIIRSVDIVDGTRIITYGSGRVLFDINFILFFALAFIVLIRKYFKSGEIIKRQLLFVIIGTLAGAVLASVTNVFLPWFNDFRFLWLGPGLTLIWIGFITYAIVRHRLLGIKLVILKSIFFILIIALIGGLSTLSLLQNSRNPDVHLDTNPTMFIFVTSLSALISGIFVVCLGIFVFHRNRRSILNRVFVLMSLALGIWLIGTYYMLKSQTDADAIFWDRFIYAGVVFIPALMYHFSRVFTKLGKQRIGLILGYFFSFVFLVLSRTDLFVSDLFYYKWGVHTQARLFHHVFLLFFFVYLFLTLRLFYIYYKKIISSGTQKVQAKYVFVAFFVLIVVGSTAYAPAYKIDIPPFSFLSGLIFTLILSYAIIRHRLLDVRLFVIRSLLYTLTVIMVGSMFTWIVFSIGENILRSTTWGIVVGSIIISLGLEPLLHFLRRVTDEYFFQERYNYQNTLRELVKSMTRIIDLQHLLDTTTITIKNALKLEKIAIALFDPDKVVPSVIKEVGFEIPLDTHLCKKKSLVKYLAETKIELVAAELEIEQERGRLNVPIERAGIIIREMRNLDIAMCIPIFSNEEMIGILALGNKKSGDVFSNDDIQLLNTFAGQAGIAIVNAKLYQEVKDFNLRLQEKVNHATRDLRRSNKELREANIRLRELDQAKSDFISLASHQLRAPLSITKGYVSMILEGTYGDCPTDLIEPLSMVYNGNERLIKFVNNLLDVSRMESGRLEYVFQNVDLSAMAESVTKELKLAADKKEIFLKTDIEKGLPLVKADDEKLRQVVMNLVDNAIKYTPSGGVTVSLKEGDSSDRKKGLIFSVTDSGRGLEEVDKASLFQKFSRGQGVSRIHTEGTGLGLYVAAKIIEAHQGTIWADSPGKDQGSTFAFWVPVGEIL